MRPYRQQIMNNDELNELLRKCIEREGIIKSPNDIDLEIYLEQNFRAYNSSLDFYKEKAAERFKELLPSVFVNCKDITIRPIVEYYIRYYLSPQFSKDCFDYYLYSNGCRCIRMRNGKIYITYTKDNNYYLDDILDVTPSMPYEYDEFESLVSYLLEMFCD